MENKYDLSDTDLEYLKFIQEHPGCELFDLTINLDTSADTRVPKLHDLGLIDVKNNNYSCLHISELGIEVLVDFLNYLKIRESEEQKFQDQLETLRCIAEEAKNQSKISEQNSKSAEKDAKFSKIVSIISILIALFALILECVQSL